jgi:hypothetical protein
MHDLAKCLNLLVSPLHDHHILALQSLTCLTDPTSTNPTTAHTVSNAILWQCNAGLDDDTTSDRLRRELLRLLRQDEMQDFDSRSSHGDGTSERSDNHCYELHFMVLQVVSNALARGIEALHSHEPQQPATWGETDWFWRTIVDVCQANVANATQAPCIAAISTRVLSDMIQYVGLLKQLNSNESTTMMQCWKQSIAPQLYNHLFLASLMHANTLGRLDHRCLEQATGELIELLQDHDNRA